MKLNDMAMYLLGEYLIDSAHELDEFYNDSMELLRGVANEKKIEFDEYYNTRWANSADTIVDFNELYFDDPDKRDLYVLLSAQVDVDIFSYLEYVWSNYYHEKLTMAIVKSKAEELISKGTKF